MDIKMFKGVPIKDIIDLAIDIYASGIAIEGADMAKGVDSNGDDNFSELAHYLYVSGWRKDDYFKQQTVKPANDNVNHPSHYTDGKIEVIDFIEDKKLNFHRGNAVKYIARAGKKNIANEVEDLEKAVWYINREIERLKKEDCEEFLKNFEEVKKQ